MPVRGSGQRSGPDRFPKAYASGISQFLKPSDMVVVTGKVNRRAEDGAAEILVEEMVRLPTHASNMSAN